MFKKLYNNISFDTNYFINRRCISTRAYSAFNSKTVIVLNCKLYYFKNSKIEEPKSGIVDKKVSPHSECINIDANMVVILKLKARTTPSELS